MTAIQPRFEIKLNTQVVDIDLMYTEMEENKILLSQFNSEEKLVYLTLNGLQLVMPIDELKLAVDMLHQAQVSQKGIHTVATTTEQPE